MTVVGDLVEEFTETVGDRDEPPILTLTEKNGFVPQAERFNKRLATENVEKYKVVHRNDLAFNPYLLWAGAVAQNTICDKGAISPLYPTFRVRTGFDPRYVGRLLLTPSIVMRYDSIAFGSVPRRRRSSVPDFLALEIPDPPPIEEQRRIAAVLDAADALRAKRREGLAKLDTLTQAIFVDMFGDPVANPHGIPTAPLDEVFDIARGGSPRPIQDFLTDNPNGINWIMIGDAPEGTKYITGTAKRIRPEGEKRSRRVHPGDLLLTNSMSFGRPYIMRTTGCIHDGWLVLSPRSDSTSPDYFHAALGMRSVYDEFVRRAPGATVKNLNIDLVRSLELPVPFEDAQARFATMVRRTEACVPRVEDSRAGLDDLFASLQQRAFRGEL